MIRVRIQSYTDKRTDYLRACGEAISHQQRLQYERVKHRLVQEILPAFLRRQAS